MAAKKKRTKRQRDIRSDTPVTPAMKQAGDNLMKALGGKDAIVQVLADSAHPKARHLMERLQSTAHIGPQGETIAQSLSAVGLKTIDMVEILGEVEQAKAFVNALMQGDEVMRSLIRRAKDKVEPHEKCNGTGHVIDRKSGKPTDEDCRACQGSGFMLVAGDLESQKLYFEIVNWRKAGGGIVIDARRQSVTNVQNNSIQGALPGEAPDVTNIIKRADQVIVPPHKQIVDSTAPEMPEDKDEPVEGELIDD